jgi:hypothetical protein
MTTQHGRDDLETYTSGTNPGETGVPTMWAEFPRRNYFRRPGVHLQILPEL